MTATLAGDTVETFPGSSTAAMVGEDDSVTQLLEEVLSRHRYQVVRHHSPHELFRNQPEEQKPATLRAGARRHFLPADADALATFTVGKGSPSLYIFNCQSSGWGRTSGRSESAWWDALEALSQRAPRTAILVVIGSGNVQALVKRALQAGADEILRADDAKIKELVWTRVQSALAKAECSPRTTSAPRRFSTEAAPGGPERRHGERRRGERRATGRSRTSTPPADTLAGDVVESWDEPAGPDEFRGARDRMNAALDQLPSPEERAGPLADLLGITSPTLRARSGRLDAKKIAERLGVSLAKLAQVTPISRQALHGTPDSVRAQAALDPLARALDVLDTVLPPERIRAWLNTPHTRLGGETPLQVILQGRAEQVARILEVARGGGVD